MSFKRSHIMAFIIFLCGITLPTLGQAQAFTVDMGTSSTLSASMIQFFLMLTVLSIAPGIVMMVTCFPFMVIVLSILRQALGVPQTPPNMMMMSLAMFLTFYVMQPIFEQSWEQGISPYMEEQIDAPTAFTKTMRPLRSFMESRVSVETSEFMKELSKAKVDPLAKEMPLTILVPSFMITEIERAFKVGFLIFIPFVIIDLVVSALLMSMGMMMLPPSSIALPIKLAFFTLSNGWSLLATALVKSYAS